MKWKAIVFDLDNTLLDRSKSFRAYSERFVDEHFGQVAAEEKERMIETIRIADRDGYRDKPELYAELLEALPWAAKKPGHASLMRFYDERYVECTALMDDAVEVLDHCRRSGLKIGLATNGRSHIQRGKLDKLGIRDYFDHVVVSGEVGADKPDPRVYRAVLEGLGAEPGHTVFVGDHPVNDIMGPAQAGMETIWVRRNQPWASHIAVRPVATVGTLKELLSLLRRR